MLLCNAYLVALVILCIVAIFSLIFGRYFWLLALRPQTHLGFARGLYSRAAWALVSSSHVLFCV